MSRFPVGAEVRINKSLHGLEVRGVVTGVSRGSVFVFLPYAIGSDSGVYPFRPAHLEVVPLLERLADLGGPR